MGKCTALFKTIMIYYTSLVEHRGENYMNKGKIKIYLDNCCYNRRFDNQEQMEDA